MRKNLIAVALAAIIVIAATGVYIVTSDKNDDTRDRELLTDALEVYGNANNDWTIDQNDVKYVQNIVDGTVEWNQNTNPYADANHDGKITKADVEKIKSLTNNTADTVWIIDGVGTEMEVKCQPQRIYAFQIQNAELATIMGYGNNIVAGGPPIEHYEEFLFPNNPHDTQYFSGDYERLSELNLDLYLVFSPTQIETPTEKLPNTDVVYLGLYYPEIADMESSVYAQGILKAGYIFGAKERAEGYLNFLLEIRDKINSYTSTLTDSEKPNVLVSQLSNSYMLSEDNHQIVAYLKNDTISQAVALAGGNNVARNLDNYDSNTTYSVKNEVEWLDKIEEELGTIDYMTIHFQKYAWSGLDSNSPGGGYTWTDSSEMYEYIDMISSRPLINVDRDHIIMLSQENRNGSSGGIMAAAYLFKAFHPDLAKDFDPDAYMETYLTEWLGMSDYNYADHKDAIIAWGDRYPDTESSMVQTVAGKD